jgi:hypothetical protein
MACCIIGAFIMATLFGVFRKLTGSYDTMTEQLINLRTQPYERSASREKVVD